MYLRTIDPLNCRNIVEYMNMNERDIANFKFEIGKSEEWREKYAKNRQT